MSPKWIARGQRRLHSRPAALEIKACRPWLDQELRLVRAEVLLGLGASAAQARLGASFRGTRERGRLLRSELVAPGHPSSQLRIEDDAERKAAIRGLVAELRPVAHLRRGQD